MVDLAAFSVENRQRILEEATGGKFDFVFTKCGLKEALFCLFASGMGFRCAMFCDGDFSTNLHPVVDPEATRKKSVQLFRNRFPHLILPDEYLHIRKEKNILSEWFANTIKEKDLPRYESNLVLPESSSVVLESEFKINSARLLLSIIKSAVSQGACVLNHIMMEQIDEHQLILSDALGQMNRSYSLKYDQLIEFAVDSDDESHKEMHICLDKKGLFLKRSLKFYVEGQLVRLIRYQDHFSLIFRLENQNIDFIRNVLLMLSSILQGDVKFDENDIISSKEIIVKNNYHLKYQLEQSEKEIRKHLKLSSSEFTERLQKLLVLDAQFGGRNEIQELIEFADFKFDEAKQTGIHPVSFKNLFYRFGSETEQLTELAYEWRSRYGSGDQLWQNVQLWYLYTHEMICSLDDYYARLSAPTKSKNSDLLIDEEIMNRCLFV